MLFSGTNCVAITGANEYLVGTSNGLFFIRDQNRSHMTFHDGVLSENINDIYFENERSLAWVATSEGLMQVDLQALRNKTTPPIKISQVTIKSGGHDPSAKLTKHFFL